ncbi:serine hydrolase [Arthrobacter sp. MYb23]|uniref:serine hydrolase n=1 Tax=unclassified Arthrobacter TaxID=235627 RepID=UPI000CFB059E|nr:MULTISPECIES: serine hydrolase [unclassified Arthrobacter]PRB36385.1 serine hydrolase [Arthrobacter sp. MYb51]PRB94250.1 serine hydrolase [Arthrobacter sp. MYb23]
MNDITDQIRAIFAEADVTGSLHARAIAPGAGEISVGADEPVVLASVFKIPVVLAFARAVQEGRVDPLERVLVGPKYRVGGIGAGGCRQDVEMSLGDLALFMLTLSDNAATDLILERVGVDAISTLLDELELLETHIGGGCLALWDTMFEDLGLLPESGFEAMGEALQRADLQSVRALDPRKSLHRSTPREITTLLSSIWAGHPDTPANQMIRSMMAEQVWTHRLSSGFDDSAIVAGKTGTLPTVRNEAGVVTLPDGSSYAVAVFLRSQSLKDRQPRADAAIGHAAYLAVTTLSKQHKNA